jgi:ribosomal protein S18 acetylase RimI-like enzyme
MAEGARLRGCYAGQSLAGFALISPLLSDGTIELFSIYVDAAQRRRGVGSLLLGNAEDEAAARSARVLHLTIRFENAAAIDFYLHRGYRLAQLTDRATVPDKHPEIRLAKTICSQPTD